MPLFGPPDVASLKAKRDVQGLSRALGYSGGVNVRRTAAAALGELGDVRAVEPLSLALKNPDWEGDWNDLSAAADALVRLGAPAVGPLIGILEWHSKVVRVVAAGALASIGRPAVRPLITLLADSDLETRETASQILADIGADAIDELIEALKGTHIGSRQRAARILGEIGEPRGVATLIQALRDPIAGVRQAAARSLGEVADPTAAESLVTALTDSDLDVRRSAALSLAAMKDPRAVPELLHELRGAKPATVLDALVKIGAPVVGPMLAMVADSKARGDEAWIVDELRSDVAAVLAGIGCPPEVGALVGQLLGEAHAERAEAASELWRLYESHGLDALTKALLGAARPMIEQVRPSGLAEAGSQGDGDSGPETGAPVPNLPASLAS
jgi:HEAT repeat protein